MAKLLYTTEDYYTDPSWFPFLSDVMSGSVYNPTTTTYNITLRSTPLCFYTVQDESLELLVENIIIKDNSWEYAVSNINFSSNTLVCTTIPVIWQTTELLVHNDDIDNIKVAPESVVNAMFNVASPDCDGDPTFCIDVQEIDDFCSINMTPNLDNTPDRELYKLGLNSSWASYMWSVTTTSEYDWIVIQNWYSISWSIVLVCFFILLADFVYFLYRKLLW